MYHPSSSPGPLDPRPSTLGWCLVLRKWRTASQLLNMSSDDKRNTVIVGLHKADRGTISQLQARSNQQLVDLCSGPLDPRPSTLGWCLVLRKWRTASQLLNMSSDDKRNTVIVGLHKAGMGTISQLQAKSDQQLVDMCRW